MNRSYGTPETTSIIRPRMEIPGELYFHFVSRSEYSGFCAYSFTASSSGMRIWSVISINSSAEPSHTPAVWVIRSRIVIGRPFFSFGVPSGFLPIEHHGIGKLRQEFVDRSEEHTSELQSL